ncbi:MAG: ATP synthase F0 subunit B [Clostridiales bacterium]|nr:ATP synthase F0 subunit B [Clostridiales bacterium]
MTLISANIFDALGLDWRSILFYLGNLVILLVILGLLLYKPIKKMLKNKRDSLNSVYDENEKLKSESEKLQADYDKKVEELQTESARLSAEVAETAQARADAIIGEAQAKAKSIVDAAKKDALVQKEQLKTEYRDSVNELAVGIAQKLLEREITEADNAALIEQALSEWEESE